MALNQEQHAKVLAWLNRHLSKCPVCGSKDLELGEITTGLPFSGGNVNIGGPTTPVVNVVCSQCGYVMQFSAIKLGLI
jgi:predicted nucleic-acid-binding Zn-ribbon protein